MLCCNALGKTKAIVVEKYQYISFIAILVQLHASNYHVKAKAKYGDKYCILWHGLQISRHELNVLLQCLNISVSDSTYHKNNDEDEADSHNDEEGDQVVFERQAEVWHKDHMSPGKTSTAIVSCWQVKQIYQTWHPLKLYYGCVLFWLQNPRQSFQCCLYLVTYCRQISARQILHNQICQHWRQNSVNTMFGAHSSAKSQESLSCIWLCLTSSTHSHTSADFKV